MKKIFFLTSFLSLLVLFSLSLAMPRQSLAQTPAIDWESLYNTVYPTPGAFGRFGTSLTIGTIVSSTLQYVFPIAGFLLLIYLIFGGYQYMTSLGEPKKLVMAKNHLTWAVVGFIIIFSAYWIVVLLAQALDLTAIQEIFR